MLYSTTKFESKPYYDYYYTIKDLISLIVVEDVMIRSFILMSSQTTCESSVVGKILF